MAFSIAHLHSTHGHDLVQAGGVPNTLCALYSVKMSDRNVAIEVSDRVIGFLSIFVSTRKTPQMKGDEV